MTKYLLLLLLISFFFPLNVLADDNPENSDLTSELGTSRMPIRRVMLNWGDDSSITNQNQQGYYPNHKPFCEGEDSNAKPTVKRCSGTQMTCASDEDCKGISSTAKCQLPEQRNFGDSSRARLPKPSILFHY